MSKISVEILLLGPKEQVANLLRFVESRGCHCSFAASGQAAMSLEQRGFDLVISAVPIEQTDPLILQLGESDCAVFYSYPVEDSCWWVPLMSRGGKCLGIPALRPNEFVFVLDQAIAEIKWRNSRLQESSKEAHS
jgi:hypothetical protein